MVCEDLLQWVLTLTVCDRSLFAPVFFSTNACMYYRTTGTSFAAILAGRLA